MRNFNQDNRSGGRRGGRRFEGRDSGGRSSGSSMHQAICSECGKECEVPFRPSGDRPVFCSNCFENKGNTNSRRFEERGPRRSNFGDKQMYTATCDKCGNKCEVPFRPTGEKPVYCSQCFGNRDNQGNKNPDKLKEQFEILNAKLDKILNALNPVFKPVTKKDYIETPKAKKAVKQKMIIEKIAKKKVVAKKTNAKSKK